MIECLYSSLKIHRHISIPTISLPYKTCRKIIFYINRMIKYSKNRRARPGHGCIYCSLKIKSFFYCTYHRITIKYTFLKIIFQKVFPLLYRHFQNFWNRNFWSIRFNQSISFGSRNLHWRLYQYNKFSK